MSPHNYHMKFNGSNNQTIKDQREFADKIGLMISYVGKGLYKYSGLNAYFNTRVFSRGIDINDNPVRHYERVGFPQGL
jgi:hypothetical protein